MSAVPNGREAALHLDNRHHRLGEKEMRIGPRGTARRERGHTTIVQHQIELSPERRARRRGGTPLLRATGEQHLSTREVHHRGCEIRTQERKQRLLIRGALESGVHK